MLTEHSIVKVHLCDAGYFPTFRYEIQHRAINQTFEVKRYGGKLGIDWNKDRYPTICEGSAFCPFETFAWTAVFEDVNTGKLYHYNNFIGGIEEIRQ